MPRQAPSRGPCAFCGFQSSAGGMARHLAACRSREARIAEARQTTRKPELLLHLRIVSADDKAYWFDVEALGSAKLESLDRYLRAIWLECCGHLSQFSFGGWRGEEIDMGARLEAVFDDDTELTHLYDFGTTSDTRIKVIGRRIGTPLNSKPIFLMARNLMPVSTCIVCSAAATVLCMECLIEEGVWGTLCDLCAKTHPHHDYESPVKLANSPRFGMCGYEGPSEAPY